MKSYQHSYPEELQVSTYEEETPPLRPSFKAKMAAVLVLGVLFVAALASFDGRDAPAPLLEASMKATSTTSSDAKAPASSNEPKLPKPPKATSEGQYDWQKCQTSNDPDCWKKEGDRVGGYWQSFGEKWRAFGESMHTYFANLFGGGGGTAPDLVDILGASMPTETEPVAPDDPTSSQEPKLPKPPKATSKGQYDWQKCQASNDPDCWKKEGDRVGGYWEGYGQKWRAFGESMHNYFADLFGGGGGKAVDTANFGETEVVAPELSSSKEAHLPSPPKSSSEGQYDWQKCQASNDPDCWEKEGNRVGGYWEGYGQKWQAFGQSMHNYFANLFGGGKTDEDEADLEASLKATKHVKSAPEEPVPTEPAIPDAPKEPASSKKTPNPNMPQPPKATSEGDYNWQKCKESNDPNCWKQEGERVGGYWHNFGLKWKAFGQSMHNFFANLFGGGKKG